MTASVVRPVGAVVVDVPARVRRPGASARRVLLLALDVAECVSRVLHVALLVAVAMAVVRLLARAVLLTSGPGAAGLVVGVLSMGVVLALLLWAEHHGWWSA